MANSINIWYWHGNQNAGDYFTKYIFEHLGYSVQLSDTPELVGCGSILSAQEVNHCKVWGSGFQNNTQHITNKKLHVLAVRGKLTARQIGMSNIVTGDPGTLASFLYKKNMIRNINMG